jgi:hypothetical protein
MEDIAQINRIISEIRNLKEKEKRILFHKVKEMWDSQDEQNNDEISIESVFGLWKDRNITKKSLREKAWKQN